MQTHAQTVLMTFIELYEKQILKICMKVIWKNIKNHAVIWLTEDKYLK